jgi:hypothetical protein
MLVQWKGPLGIINPRQRNAVRGYIRRNIVDRRCSRITWDVFADHLIRVHLDDDYDGDGGGLVDQTRVRRTLQAITVLYP